MWGDGNSNLPEGRGGGEVDEVESGDGGELIGRDAERSG